MNRLKHLKGDLTGPGNDICHLVGQPLKVKLYEYIGLDRNSNTSSSSVFYHPHKRYNDKGQELQIIR